MRPSEAGTHFCGYKGIRMTIEQQIFTPAEVEVFRADDRSAATAIVGLMAGIFTLGLIGYLGVCLWVG